MKVLVKTFVRRCWFYAVEALELALTSVKLYIIKIVGEMVFGYFFKQWHISIINPSIQKTLMTTQHWCVKYRICLLLLKYCSYDSSIFNMIKLYLFYLWISMIIHYSYFSLKHLISFSIFIADDIALFN